MVNNSFATFQDPIDYIYVCCALFCVLCAALAAVGTVEEKKAAKNILPLIENHHFLLCTLLLFNAVANEALPIFLDEIVPSWAAIIVAVTLVLLCGEVLPTALFTGPNQLQIASRFTGLVYFLQFIFYPIARPMGIALDHMMGEDDEGDNLNRDEISAMMQILRENKMNPANHPTSNYELNRFGAVIDSSNSSNVNSGSMAVNPMLSRDDAEEPLSANEVNVITGVLGLAKKTIRNVFTPIGKVNMLSSDQMLDAETLEAIDKVGHSRLPVFKGTDTSHIIGFLLVKRLITINPEKHTPLMSLPLLQPIVVGASQSLLDVLNIFQLGSSHLALVSEDPDELQYHIVTGTPPKASCAPIGILSIEDIFEEMIQSEIYDEEDIHKGPDQEHASLHLKEISLRSSFTPDSFLVKSMQQQPIQPMDPKQAQEARIDAIVNASSSPSSAPAKHMTYTPVTTAAEQGARSPATAAVDISTVSRNTKMNAQTSVRSKSTAAQSDRSKSLGYSRRESNSIGSSAGSARYEDDEEFRHRVQSATSEGKGSYIATHQSSSRITPSMVKKYIRRRRSSANLQQAAADLENQQLGQQPQEQLRHSHHSQTKKPSFAESLINNQF